MLVETWLWWAGDWHVRLHRIEAPVAMTTIEGGFAIARLADDTPAVLTARHAWIRGGGDVTAIVDIGPVARRARLQRFAPNSRLIQPRALVPQLVGAIPAGETWLAAAIYAGRDDPPPPPILPIASDLERILGVERTKVPVHLLPPARIGTGFFIAQSEKSPSPNYIELPRI